MWIFLDYTFWVVALGSGILGLVCGVLGSFAVLRKESLLGDGVSHGALPGVVLAFLLWGNQRTEVLLLGALGSSLLVAYLIHFVVSHSRIPFDNALALLLSVFFGLGMVLLTYAQKQPNANQAGLNRFLFGQAAALLVTDVQLLAVVGGVLLFLVVALWKVWKLLCFDAGFAYSLGYHVDGLGLGLSLMLVMAIVLGLQTVGVVLMSALLVAPAVAARQWTHHLWSMVVLAGVLGAVSGIVGTAISTWMPKVPTGATIVLWVSALAVLSILWAPERGVIQGYLTHRALRRQCEKEGQP